MVIISCSSLRRKYRDEIRRIGAEQQQESNVRARVTFLDLQCSAMGWALHKDRANLAMARYKLGQIESQLTV